MKLAALPLDHNPQTPAVDLFECEECGVYVGEMRRASVGEGEQDTHQQRAHAELAGPHPEPEGVPRGARRHPNRR